MKREDILSNPILSTIFEGLTKEWRNTPELPKIKKQVIKIIQSCLLGRLFDHYKVPKPLYFVTDPKAESRLITHLKEQHAQRKEKVTEEQIREEIEAIYELFDQVINNEINKE